MILDECKKTKKTNNKCDLKGTRSYQSTGAKRDLTERNHEKELGKKKRAIGQKFAPPRKR